MRSTLGWLIRIAGYASSQNYRTEFVYKLFEITCGGGFQTNSTSYAGGATTAKTTAPKAVFCVEQQAGTTFTKSHTSAFTFAGGVSITKAIGVNLSTQTGYDSNASLAYHFSKTHDVCGTNDYPGGTPRRIVAGLRH